MGIIDESKKSKKSGFFGFFRQKKFYFLLIVLIASGSAYFYYQKKGDTTQVVIEQKKWTVKKDDIKISVESDGKVVAEDGVELSFSVSGDNLEVENVFVKEGDKIKKGDKVATVKTESLEMSLKNAYTSYQATLADYNESVAGASEKEKKDAQDKIKSAEISLAQAKISLENTKQSSQESITNAEDKIYDAKKSIEDAQDDVDDAKKDLDENQDEATSKDISDAYKSLVDAVKSINISLDNILKSSDEILGIDNTSINDDFENVLGVKDSASLTSARNAYTKSKNSLSILDSLAVVLSLNSSYEDIDKASSQAGIALKDFESQLYYLKLTLEASVVSSSFSQNELDSFISKNNSNRSSVNSSLTSLNTKINALSNARDKIDDYVKAYNDAQKKLKDAEKNLSNAQRDLENVKINVKKNIENAETGLKTKEMSIEQAKRDYEDLIAPMTDAELAQARSKLTSSSISYEKAKLDLEKATIISPIDGEVAMLNYKAGDIIVDNSASDPVAVIINNDTLFIEINIEEADINKIQVGQKAKVVFDSLDELELSGEVSFISLTSETNNSGIVTYLVRVIVDNSEKNQIREGMTASVDFITAEAVDVLVVPVDAVKNVSGKASVQLESGEWMSVVTGFTDGESVEVVSGVKVGDKILY